MNIFGLKIIFGLFLIGFILVISHILNKLEDIVNMKLLNGSEKKVAMETYIYGFIIGFFYALVMAVFTIILLSFIVTTSFRILFFYHCYHYVQ